MLEPKYGEEIAILEVAPETAITPGDKKEAAFLMPAKEDIAGFTCHAFAKSRKGFVIATGNELLNTERHLAAYKAAHPEWKAEVLTTEMTTAKIARDLKAEAIEDLDERAKKLAESADEFEGNLEWSLMTIAVPDFMFHLTALAYLCVGSAQEISRLIGKSREYFAEKVTAWGDTLTDDQWDKLTIRAFQELVESNIGNDFKVKEEKTSGIPGDPKSPS